MDIHVNGKQRQVADELSLYDLLIQLDVSTDRIAVERNLVIVPRSLWQDTQLHANDRIEIVHAIGGG